MKIRETFDESKDINRRIEKVITYAASDPQQPTKFQSML